MSKIDCSSKKMSEEKYILVLTGKTGVGKSALGNAILGEDKFTSSDSGTSVTTECLLERANRSDLLLTVIDTPGFMDTGENANGAKLKAVKEMKKLMVTCPTDGKLAVIFVIKYNERFTEENKITLQILQSIFGRDHIWKSCIIVVTMGEMFDLTYGTKKSFKQYMQDESGELGELFKRCNYKCVLFYNKTNDEKQKTEQFNTLIQYVKELDQGYTTSKFKDAQREQNRLELESKLSNYENEFQQKIEQIKDELDNLNLTSKSLDDLININDIIFQNLEMVDGIDTPKEIYYESGETRLLEKIRKSFENLKQLNLKNQEIVQQLKMKDELEVKINVILEDIKKTNIQDKDIIVVIEAFEEKLANVENTKMEETLKKEHCDYINVKLTNCRQEFELLKLKVQKQKESEINAYTLQLTQRLNTIEIGDKESHELFSTLKCEFEAFKGKFKEEHKYMSEDFLKNMKLILNDIKTDILKKSDTLSQWDQASKIRESLNEIEKNINCTKPNDLQINEKLLNFEKKIQVLILNFQESNFIKDFKNNLQLSANEAQQALKDLKESVRKNKENEINNIVNNIYERLKNVKVNDKEVTEVLKKLEDERLSVKGTLEKEKNETNTIFVENMSRTLDAIKDNIDDKRKAVEQAMLTEAYKEKIDNLIKEISETNSKDEKIQSTTNDLENKIKLVKIEIKGLPLSNEFTPILEASMQKATDAIKKLKKSVKANTESKIKSQIEDIISRTKEIQFSNQNVQNDLMVLKKDIVDVKNLLMENKDSLSKNYFDIMNRSISQTHQEIINLQSRYEQFNIVNELVSKINDLTSKIIDTSQTDDSGYIKINKYAEKLKTLQKESKNTRFHDSFKEMLTSANRKAKESINKWKREVKERKENKFNYKIQFFHEQLDKINESNVNIVNTLNNIKEDVHMFELEVKKAKHIDENYKDMTLGQLKKVLQKIEEIKENVRQSTEADIIIKDLNTLISDIVHTDPRSDNIIQNLSDYKNRWSEIDRNVTKIRDQKHLNLIKLKREQAYEKLSILKSETQKANSMDISNLCEELKTIDHTKRGCFSIISDMELKFAKMDKRFQKSQAQFNKCKTQCNELKDRATKYIPMHYKLEKLITDVKNLPYSWFNAPYKPYTEKALNLKKEVKKEVTNKGDRNALKHWIKKLLIYTDKSDIRKNSSNFFSLFPFIGDAL